MYASSQSRPPAEHPYASSGAADTSYRPQDQISMGDIGASMVSQPVHRRSQGLDAILDEDYEY